MGKKRRYIKKMVKTGKSPEYLASCYGKVRYIDLESAQDKANELSYANQVAYKCRFCPYYHVGRRQ